MKQSIAVVLILLTVPAWAQIPIPTGDHEALLGNTGIARLGSPAAALYNPAGLASIERTQVSASGTLFQNSVQDLSGDARAHSDNFQSIPTQLSSTGVHNGVHYAFSVFTARSSDYTAQLKMDYPGVSAVPTRVKAIDTSLLIGPSIGIPYRKDFYWGASLFLQKNDSYLNAVARIDNLVAGNQVHVLAQSETQTSTYELLPIFGAAWQYNGDTLLGARLQLPTIAVTGHQTLSTQSVGYKVDNSNNVSDASTADSTLKENAKTVTPMEISAGVAHQLEGERKVFVDVGYSLSTKWRPTASADEEHFAGAVKLSAGIEIGPASDTWAAGVFYRQNSLREEAGEVRSFTGLSFGYIKATEHFDSGIGGSYVFGSGTTDGVTNKLSNLGLLVSSTYKF